MLIKIKVTEKKASNRFFHLFMISDFGGEKKAFLNFVLQLKRNIGSNIHRVYE